MIRWMRWAAAGVMVTGAGCVKRHETVAVFPDGSGKLVFAFVGDADDVREGDAVPTPESGWSVREHLEIKPADSPGEPDKRELTLAGSRRVAVGEAWPASYAAEGSRLARIATRFPTEVWTEERPEGTYHHFRRVYKARRVARINYLEAKILDQDSIKAIREKDPDTLTDDERRTLIEALIEFEREKARTLLDRAVAGLEPELRQDDWLAARRAAGNAYERPGLAEEAAEIAKSEDSQDRFQAVEQRIRDEVEADVRTALSGRGVGGALIDRVIDGLRLATEDFEISTDIKDEQFNVRVVLPGRIIAHNSGSTPERVKGDEMEDDDEDDDSIDEVEFRALLADLRGYMADGATFEWVEWDVDGDALYDTDVVLAATSFVPRTPDQ